MMMTKTSHIHLQSLFNYIRLSGKLHRIFMDLLKLKICSLWPMLVFTKASARGLPVPFKMHSNRDGRVYIVENKKERLNEGKNGRSKNVEVKGDQLIEYLNLSN